MPDRRSILIGFALGAGCGLALAGPAFFLWDALRTSEWDSQALSIRYEMARYEAGGLVFTYSLENHTGRALRVNTDSAELRLLRAPGAPELGLPALSRSFNVFAKGSRLVDVRLDLRPDGEGTGPMPFGNSYSRPPRVPAGAIQGFELIDHGSNLRIVFPAPGT